MASLPRPYINYSPERLEFAIGSLSVAIKHLEQEYNNLQDELKTLVRWPGHYLSPSQAYMILIGPKHSSPRCKNGEMPDTLV